MKRTVMGILAHVDAGKTTLSEALLYEAGAIRKIGRVDRRDTFLDTATVERDRGITVFAKQAVFEEKEVSFTLLDTPGHVDFSAETERTMQVLDFAVLVVSGSEGVQSHTETLWRLLRHYHVPVFLFVNKMDMPDTDKERVLAEIAATLDDRCVDAENPEEVAMAEESLMEEFLETGEISEASMKEAVAKRRLFPCFFGAALVGDGVRAFLEKLADWAPETTQNNPADEPFGARVFKITHDEKGQRLAHMKITSGVLHVRDELEIGLRKDGGATDAETVSQKVSEIRVYSAESYRALKEATCGMVVQVTGLDAAEVGTGLGTEQSAAEMETKPVLLYRVLPATDENHREIDSHRMLEYFRELEEEDPQLAVVWNSEKKEISLKLMGEVQLQIITTLMKERFGAEVSFDAGSILYRETIENTVEGVGHYEPLRHYAEVHLVLEPAKRGEGMIFETDCSEDLLDLNWQRLILTHLYEKEHLGVQLGVPVTDVKITLAAGRAHNKHTNGGDFREATYRAVRNGLMKAKSLILEPWYRFRMVVPSEHIGRAMSDVRKMGGDFEAPLSMPDSSDTILEGRAPVSELREYSTEINNYTRGKGRIVLHYDGYDICHNAEEVLSESNYQPTRDLENTPDSVFCEKGGGFVVSWDRVDQYMHLESALKKQATSATFGSVKHSRVRIDDKELASVLARAGGLPREKRHRMKKRENASGEIRRTDYQQRRQAKKSHGPDASKEKYTIIDGYNLIFAWDELASLAKENVDAARDRLLEILDNYNGFLGEKMLVVFDAYKVKGGQGSRETIGSLDIVYTAFEETADSFIERFTHENSGKYFLRVVTSDALEQMIAMGHGAMRMSSREFLAELETVEEEIKQILREK